MSNHITKQPLTLELADEIETRRRQWSRGKVTAQGLVCLGCQLPLHYDNEVVVVRRSDGLLVAVFCGPKCQKGQQAKFRQHQKNPEAFAVHIGQEDTKREEQDLECCVINTR